MLFDRLRKAPVLDPAAPIVLVEEFATVRPIAVGIGFESFSHVLQERRLITGADGQCVRKSGLDTTFIRHSSVVRASSLASLTRHIGGP